MPTYIVTEEDIENDVQIDGRVLITKQNSPLEAEQQYVFDTLPTAKREEWIDGQLDVTIGVLHTEEGGDPVVWEPTDLNVERERIVQEQLDKMRKPEGGWPKGSDADLL